MSSPTFTDKTPKPSPVDESVSTVPIHLSMDVDFTIDRSHEQRFNSALATPSTARPSVPSH
jgi:hypothetical protein